MDGIKVKNLDTMPHSWGGVYFTPGFTYICQNPSEEEYFSRDSDFLQQVALGKAEIYRGDAIVTNPQQTLAAVQSAGKISRYTYATTAANSVTSSTYSSVSELISVFLPAGLYRFDFEGIFQSATANNGVGVRLSNTAGTLSTIGAKWNIGQSISGASQSYIYDQVSVNDNQASPNSPAANSPFVVTGKGVFRLLTPGAVSIQVRSETNNTVVSLMADSVFRLELI